MEEETESVSNFTDHESVDLDYFKEMYQYEIKARKETESIEMSIEEENQIVCKIKDDILNMVRDEMESELAKYQLVSTRTSISVNSSFLANGEMDPLIRKGLLQIKKLDKILLRKMQKEKEVKRERILLQKRLREELSELENNNKQLSKEVKTNVMKFLALKPPMRHNEGMDENTAEDEIPKLFQTEINQEDITFLNQNNTKSDKNRSNFSPSSSKSPSKKSEHRSSVTVENPIKDKDFIKRNIELASKASEPILLTDAEKDRLNHLLADIDEEKCDAPYSVVVTSNLIKEREENPFQMIALDQFSNDSVMDMYHNSEFHSALSDESNITSVRNQYSVESRLKMYMGDEKYKQLSQTDNRNNIMDNLSYQIPLATDLEVDIDRLGEKSLKEVKHSRETVKRLQEIDDRLSQLKDQQYEQLDEVALQLLIKSSRDTLSRSNFSCFTGEDGIMYDEETQSESLPEFKVEKLNQNILDALLQEARLNGINPKRLNTISEINDTDECQTNSRMSDLESQFDLNCSSLKSERSSRFPDINLYKQLTSPLPRV